MNRVWGMLKWVREKMNIKLALLVLVMGTGMFTAWQVYSRISKPKQLPEPKKITTGGTAEGDLATQASAESPVAEPNGPPPTQPQFAFNPNAFGPPGGAPPAAPPPAYGDDVSTPPPAPYQPVVAGNSPSYGPPTFSGPPAFNNPPAPPQDGAPEQPSNAPPNPIRGGGFAVGDQAEQAAAEPSTAPPADEPPSENLQPLVSSPPATLRPGQLAPAPLQPSPEEYANRFNNPPSPAPAPLEQQQPPTAYQPPVAAPLAPPVAGPTPGGAGALSPRSLGNYGAPAAASPREMVAGREATGQGTPGERQLEGAQTPALTLEKIAPAEIQVGKLATFELRVKNVGQIAAQQVQVTDHIPKGTQLVEARPQFQRAADGTLVWPLGTMQAGDEQVIQLQVMPQQEGEIGSVAQVTFAASATARSVCTRPLWDPLESTCRHASLSIL